MLACTGRRSRLGCSSKHGPPGGNLQTRELLDFLLHTSVSMGTTLVWSSAACVPLACRRMPEKPSKD